MKLMNDETGDETINIIQGSDADIKQLIIWKAQVMLNLLGAI